MASTGAAGCPGLGHRRTLFGVEAVEVVVQQVVVEGGHAAVGQLFLDLVVIVFRALGWGVDDAVAAIVVVERERLVFVGQENEVDVVALAVGGAVQVRTRTHSPVTSSFSSP